MIVKLVLRYILLYIIIEKIIIYMVNIDKNLLIIIIKKIINQLNKCSEKNVLNLMLIKIID